MTTKTKYKLKATSLLPNVIPVPQIEAQSPVCLIKGHPLPCNHKLCSMAFKRPQYFGISIEQFYNTHKFLEFDVIRSSYSPPHIIPHNPNPGIDDNFEGFRQAMNSVIHLAGIWPDIKIVAREHVEFRWTEHIDTYPVTNHETLKTEWRERDDVSEFAYYIGPPERPGLKEIDINAVFELPEILKENPNTPAKDWCRCAAESDYCGEDCRQLKNKDFIQSYEKGGCSGK